MITKIAFVAHPTTDMGSMKSFYGDVLGLKQSADYGDMWAEFDAPDVKSIALDPEGNLVMLHQIASWRSEEQG